MLNTMFTPSRTFGAWAAAVTLIVAAGLAMGSSLSTTVFVLALSTTPGIVIALLAHCAPSPSVAQIPDAVTRDGRS